MLDRHLIEWMILAGLTTLAAGGVYGQTYPDKSIRIVTGAAGGGSDQAARLIAQGISGPLGQPVIVDNRPSAIIVADVTAKAAPDGYTLMVQGASLYINPILQTMPYDYERDFASITMIARDVFVLVVHPSLPVKSVKELIAMAKAKPGELNYGASNVGGPPQLGMELFKSMAGVNIVAVPYKGTVQAFNGVLTGEVPVTVADTALVEPHAKTGRLRSLAVTSAEPSALVPGLPTVASAGLPGYELVGVTGLWTQAKTPAAIVSRINQEVVRFLNRPEVKERFLKGQQEIVANSPEQFTASIKSDVAKWSKLFRDTGIKAN